MRGENRPEEEEWGERRRSDRDRRKETKDVSASRPSHWGG